MPCGYLKYSREDVVIGRHARIFLAASISPKAPCPPWTNGCPPFYQVCTIRVSRCFSVALILLQTALYDIFITLAVWLMDPVFSMFFRISARPLPMMMLLCSSTIHWLDLSFSLGIKIPFIGETELQCS